jgi:hypothetical protein
MDVVRYLLIAVHLLGMAAIVGGWFTVLKAPRVLPSMVWGARLQVISGFLLWGILESGAADDAGDPNRVKLTVKLLVAIAVVGLAESNLKKGDQVNPRIVHAIGALAVVNVLIAVLWR